MNAAPAAALNAAEAAAANNAAIRHKRPYLQHLTDRESIGLLQGAHGLL